jgi:hypothetical protein
VSYQVNWEILAPDQAAGFLRDDPAGVVAQASYRKASRGRRPGEFAEGQGYLRVAMMRETVTRTAAQDYGGDAHQEPFLACLSLPSFSESLGRSSPGEDRAGRSACIGAGQSGARGEP